MTTVALIAYSVALLIAVATPGPAMFAVVTTGVARGVRPAIAAGLGVAAGDVILVALAMLGLVALAAAFGWVFAVVKYAGAAYLIWLGIKMWRTPSRPHDGTNVEKANSLLRAFGLGGAVALGNPKAILFHASLMPLFIDLRTVGPVEAATILVIVFAINAGTMGVYALLSGRASGWFQTPARLRFMNRLAGATMMGTGAVIATR